MNIKKMRILSLSCLAFLVLACSKDKIEGLSEGDETCGVSFALKADYTLNEVVLTRSASVPADEEFKVRIENTRADILKEWEYGNLPSLIKVVPGSYKLVGWFGSDTLLPAFERPYYYGETKITLKDGDVLDTIVPVKVAATKVAVVFDESFGYDYDDYFVDIKTVGDSLRFLKEETREGYFLPGKLRMRFGLKPKGSDTYYQFYPDAIANVKAKQFYKMTLKAQTKNGALSMISITTDSTTIDIPVEVELPPFYLPKKAPVVNLAADDGMEEGNILTTEGLSKKAVAMITSAAGLTELKIKTVSDTLLNRGWPAEFDLMKATPEQKALLKANGLDWSEEIDVRDTIKTTVWVSFNNVVKLLNTAPGQTASSLFEIDVKDRFDQAGNECKFGIKVAPPVFEFVNEPGEGNVFATRAIYDIRYLSEVRVPVIECKGVDGSWKALDTKLAKTDIEIYQCTGKGLSPATGYSFRIRLGGHVLEAGNHVTETALQIPNSGFEEWSEEMVWEKTVFLSGGKKVYAFYPYASGTTDSWWNTRNRTTTQPLADASWFYAAYPGSVPTAKTGWTATEHLNSHGGMNLPQGAYAGNSAMEIATVGWGKNNWSGFSKNAQYKTPGILYIGNYDLSAHTENFGHSFASRPTGIQFYYRFYSYNNETTKAYAELKDENGDRIGYGEFKISNSTDIYQIGNIELNYSQLKKLSTLTIVFLSTDAESPETLAIQGSEGAVGKGYGDSRHIGSVLTVDEVELIY